MNEIDNIRGMTANERLYHFGLLKEFDSAIRSRNLSIAVQVLIKAKFNEATAQETASATLANPIYYGY